MNGAAAVLFGLAWACSLRAIGVVLLPTEPLEQVDNTASGLAVLAGVFLAVGLVVA